MSTTTVAAKSTIRRTTSKTNNVCQGVGKENEHPRLRGRAPAVESFPVSASNVRTSPTSPDGNGMGVL